MLISNNVKLQFLLFCCCSSITLWTYFLLADSSTAEIHIERRLGSLASDSSNTCRCYLTNLCIMANWMIHCINSSTFFVLATVSLIFDISIISYSYGNLLNKEIRSLWLWARTRVKTFQEEDLLYQAICYLPIFQFKICGEVVVLLVWVEWLLL